MISATGNAGFTFWVFLYAMVWFLAFAAVVALAMRAVRARFPAPQA